MDGEKLVVTKNKKLSHCFRILFRLTVWTGWFSNSYDVQ